jgi:polyisoprenoid-binding protein YceI
VLPIFAHADTWQIDPANTNVEFTMRHMMISNVKGQFQKTSGTIIANGNDPSSAQIDATIDASSVDTRVEGRDAHLKGPDFLDVAKYPTITFKSTVVEAAGPPIHDPMGTPARAHLRQRRSNAVISGSPGTRRSMPAG